MIGHGITFDAPEVSTGEACCSGFQRTALYSTHVDTDAQSPGGPNQWVRSGVASRRLSAEVALERGEYGSANDWDSGSCGALLHPARPLRCDRPGGSTLNREDHPLGRSPGISGASTHGSYSPGPWETPDQVPASTLCDAPEAFAPYVGVGANWPGELPHGEVGACKHFGHSAPGHFSVARCGPGSDLPRQRFSDHGTDGHPRGMTGRRDEPEAWGDETLRRTPKTVSDDVPVDRMSRWFFASQIR